MAKGPSNLRAYSGNDPYIFVSYAHADTDEVYRELSWLNEAGYNIWFDEGISPAHDWPEELATAIEEASLFVLFVTPESVNSNNCLRETTFAVNKGRPVLAVHLQDTILPRGLELSIGNSQAVLRPKLDEETYRSKLMRTLDEHVGETHEVPLAEATPKSRRPLRFALAAIAVVAIIGLYFGFTAKSWTQCVP